MKKLTALLACLALVLLCACGSKTPAAPADASQTPAAGTEESPRSGKVQDMGQYETVFVGFPIWWYQAPRIIETFLESYDFSGKKVVPFATSGGSGLGKTEDILKAVCPAAQWLPGKRLRSGESAGAVQGWVDKLDI